MATFDNSEWQARQAQAERRELAGRLARINELEAILGIPRSSAGDYSSALALTQRIDNLRAQIGPVVEDEDTFKQPFYLRK